ncbi:MAG: hypothetical protein Q8M96_22155, partial [Rubrivivax sp.]|nr:hypothetical protein [Rubrivivax sp.]
MSQPAYMQERWFSLLQAACKPPAVKAEVAQRLGVSAPLLYQVLNGSGLYGSGKASTRRLADKVLHQLGSYTCPHLSEQHNEERVITSDQCRNYAHRPAPTASPRDLVALGRSLAAVPRLALMLTECRAPLVRSLVGELDDLSDVRHWVEAAIMDEPPALAREGGFVRDGFDPVVDELRIISRSGKQVIAEMEEGERIRTGISSLKVRFNRVFGYYIEITKSNLQSVPA